MWNPEGQSRDSRGGTSPGATQQVSQGVWGENITEQDRKEFQKDGRGSESPGK